MIREKLWTWECYGDFPRAKLENAKKNRQNLANMKKPGTYIEFSPTYVWPSLKFQTDDHWKTIGTINVLAKFENDPWKIMDVRVLTDFPRAKLENAKKNFFFGEYEKTRNLYWLPC